MTSHDRKGTKSHGVMFSFIIILLISDFMSRQSIIVFAGDIKREFGIGDRQLGQLMAIVPLVVAVFSVPLSVMADRWGRQRSIAIMAGAWALGTLACAQAQSYNHLLAGRLVIGLGEAAYGSVGLALLLASFPRRWHGSLVGIFLSGGVLGSILGMVFGSYVAPRAGWRHALALLGGFAAVLTLCFVLFIAAWGRRSQPTEGASSFSFSAIFMPGLVRLSLASGIQLMVSSALMSWMPTWLVRAHAIPLSRAAFLTSLFMIVGGVGMFLWGWVFDLLSRRPLLARLLPPCLCASSGLSVYIGLSSPTWTAATAPLLFGTFMASGVAVIAATLVSAIAPGGMRATGLSILAVSNNVFGMAIGPAIVGGLSDRVGLTTALSSVCLASLVASILFLFRNGPNVDTSDRHLGLDHDTVANDVTYT